jgi:hypothetical protein
MKPTLKQFGKHSDSLVTTGNKKRSSQQNSAIGKTENSSLDCRGPYPPFYPPVENFRRALSASGITRFSQFTQR